MNLYRNIFKEAFLNSWRSKYLWFFGLFAALLGGVEADIIFGNYGGRGVDLAQEFQALADTGILSRAGWTNILKLAASEPFTFFILISILSAVVLLFGFLVWVSITAEASLIYSAGKIRLGKEHSFRDSFRAGLNFFWPVLVLNFGLRFFLGVLLFLLYLPFFKNPAGFVFSGSGLVFVLMFLVFVPIAIISTFIMKYSSAYVVIKGEKMGHSLRLAWSLFLENWLVSLEMAFLLFFFSFIGALFIIFSFLILMAPLLFIVLLFQNILSIVNVVIILGAIFILYVFAVIAFGSFFTSFRTLSWTNLFVDLISKGGASKLARIFTK